MQLQLLLLANIMSRHFVELNMRNYIENRS